MVPAFEAYPMDVGFVTYTDDGELVVSLSYPSLSFLLFVPQVLAGIDNPNITPIVALFVVVVVLVRRSPAYLAAAPLALLFANLNLVRFTYAGTFDILWVLPLLFAMRFWATQRWRAAAVCFGLACAVKQTPWLIAPYLALWLYLESPDRQTFVRRARDCLLFGGGAFLLPNLPFIVADPGAWLRGVLTPLGSTSPLFIQGTGLSLIEASGVADMSRSFFTVALVGSHDPEDLGRVSELELAVTNGSDRPLSPVFDVVRHGHSARFSWPILRGPALLAPRDSAVYRIASRIQGATLEYGGTFVVSLRDRASRLTMKSEPFVVTPLRDAQHLVFNPRFVMWEAPTRGNGSRPVAWTPITSEPSAETRISRVDDGVELVVGKVERTQPGPWTMAGLAQGMPLPRTLHLELTPKTVLPDLTLNPRSATGVEIADQERRVWIIPTRTDRQTTRYRGGPLEYVYVFVPARSGERLAADIDLEAIYRERDWPVPEPSTDERRADAVVHLLLFAAVYPGEGAAAETAEIVFHSVEAREAPP
jgi:hypothetical protein